MPTPTPADAAAFLDRAERELHELTIAVSRAAWVYMTHITPDTQALAAAAEAQASTVQTAFAKEAAHFDDLVLPEEQRRKLHLLKLSLVAPAPEDPVKVQELADVSTQMGSAYGQWTYTPAGKEPMRIEAIEKEVATSRDSAWLLELWKGWHAVSPQYKDDYARFVELSNEGARDLGYADTGAMWRAKYDMEPDAFATELDRLWEQVKPLYVSLHAYVRARLHAKYGSNVVDPEGPIPAHLLGNLWAQTWGNIYDVVAPEGIECADIDLTEKITDKNIDELEMVRIAERFFTSLGCDPLPQTFWERSLFVRPRDREVVAHASAWDMDGGKDVRLKMCIQKTEEDFHVIHHELGHVFYFQQYAHLPVLFRGSANDGFHEAVGDTVSLSVTPKYLKVIGLIDAEPDPGQDIPLLLMQALESVAFLPFGLLIDRWRWKVFSGEVTPAEYNRAWWELRETYQGVAAPVLRTEDDFDAGAKYHVPSNTPYTRYFLARILQFQFHRALCAAAGETGPLHRASIYGSKEAGAKLRAMLRMGESRPWPEALAAISGTPEMDATAILDYFAPLKEWLDKQNEGKPIGWA